MPQFLDLDCVELANQSLSLLITRSVGPRLISLRLRGGSNLLAELPDFTLPYPGGGLLHLWGGHRLWHAPEVAARTYLPDDQPVHIEAVPGGVIATQAVEAQTGLQKSLRITLPDQAATVVVDHRLTNRGLWPVTCAPWAITQLQPGGTALLPLPSGLADPDGLQPNRVLVLWPYTNLSSPFLHWGNDITLVAATVRAGALKVGFANRRGWLGYLLGDTLFVKRARWLPAASYLDHGASSQCYCRQEFLELETLGPETVVKPGAWVNHREVWQVFPHVHFDGTEASAVALAEALALDRPHALLGTD